MSPECAPAHAHARRIEQRRQEQGQDQIRPELDAGHAGNETQAETDQDQEDGRRQRRAPGGDCRQRGHRNQAKPDGKRG